jgi:hypothetical protein
MSFQLKNLENELSGLMKKTANAKHVAFVVVSNLDIYVPVAKALSEQFSFANVPLCTTRVPTEAEAENNTGKEYVFITNDMFDRPDNDIVEEMTFIFGSVRYGTRWSDFLPYIEEEKSCMVITGVEGAEALKKMFGDKFLTVYIRSSRDEKLPPLFQPDRYIIKTYRGLSYIIEFISKGTTGWISTKRISREEFRVKMPY